MVTALTLVVVAPACTKWGTTTTYGQRREVGRRLVGAPQVARTSSSSMSAGFSGASASSADGRRGAAVAGLSGNSGSITRTHCIQAAEVDYEQPYDITSKVENRPLDIAGGIALGVIGLGVMIGSKAEEPFFEPGDPFYEEPRTNTTGMAVGGLMLIGGIGLLTYSYTSLPKGPAPKPTRQLRTWTASEYVEASGCGLVPGDQAGAPAVQPVVPPRDPRPPARTTPTPTAPGTSDTAARLKKLEELRAAGLITEAEYKTKRQAVLDEL